MLPVIAGLLLSVACAVGIVRGIRSLRDRRDMKRVSLEVKKRLITAENYSALDSWTLSMFRREIIRRHVISFLMGAAVAVILIIAALIDRSGVSVIAGILLLTLLYGSFIAAVCAYNIKRVSPAGQFIKIKGFIFRSRGSYEVSVMYYDMVKLKYRIHTQDMFFRKTDNARLGDFVNLVGIRKDRRVKIIRILTF